MDKKNQKRNGTKRNATSRTAPKYQGANPTQVQNGYKQNGTKTERNNTNQTEPNRTGTRWTVPNATKARNKRYGQDRTGCNPRTKRYNEKKQAYTPELTRLSLELAHKRLKRGIPPVLSQMLRQVLPAKDKTKQNKQNWRRRQGRQQLEKPKLLLQNLLRVQVHFVGQLVDTVTTSARLPPQHILPYFHLIFECNTPCTWKGGVATFVLRYEISVCL